LQIIFAPLYLSGHFVLLLGEGNRERCQQLEPSLAALAGESDMQHYGFEEWIDFARGLVPEALSRAMDEHLKTGCADCAHEFATWKSVYSFATGESFCEPPADLVLAVKSAVAPPASRRVTERTAEIAQLIFDSFAQPQLEGVRSEQVTTRQLMYKAGSLLIDMQLQPLENSSWSSLTGQVMNENQADREVDTLHVHLLSGRKELAHTHTDRYGEFYVEYDPQRDLQLSLEVSPDKDVFVPLDEALWRTRFNG
jgi:hypothetical protein